MRLLSGSQVSAAAAEPAAAPAAGARVHRRLRGSTHRRAGCRSTSALPVAGSIFTSQRSWLSCDRTVARQLRAIVRAVRQAPVHDARDRLVAGLRRLLVAGERRRVGPQRPVLLEVEDGEQAPRLRVADVGPAVDHLGVGRFGDVVRHVLVARRHLRALGHRDEHVVLVGRQQHVADRLPRARLEPGDRFRRRRRRLRRAAAPAALTAAHRRGAAAAALLALFGLALEMLDQLLFLLAEDALRLGQPWSVPAAPRPPCACARRPARRRAAPPPRRRRPPLRARRRRRLAGWRRRRSAAPRSATCRTARATSGTGCRRA